MRALLGGLVILAACGSSPPPEKHEAPPIPTSIATPLPPPPPTCADAAFGFERATKALRPPEQEVIQTVRAQCLAMEWSQAAIACFAKLHEESVETEDKLPCMTDLPDEAQAVLLGQLRGEGNNNDAEIADVKTRLAALQIGITSCDEFVQAVGKFMDCDRVDVDARIQLGNETADAWSLSVARLSLADKVRMAGACKNSLQSLKHHAQQNAC
jgi:hypothetical protein